MLRTEADLLRALQTGTYTLDELYQLAGAQADMTSRSGGEDVVHGEADLRWKRRVRGALQTLRRSGRAHRVGAGVWAIAGTRDAPTGALLLLPDGRTPLTLMLADVVTTLRSSDEPYDLVIADPPWGLDRNGPGTCHRRVYARDDDKVMPGYVEAPAEFYREFLAEWVPVAAQALRPGGYLVLITGPQRAAAAQIAAEDAGLTYVNQIISGRRMPVATKTRFAHAHVVSTVMCAGPLNSPGRYFHVPDDLPVARSGRPYPKDVWPDIVEDVRRGLLRYDNAQPLALLRRLLHAFTPGPESGGDPWQALIADPFVGSGTSAVAAWQMRRRGVFGDLNPHALRFAMARLTAEHLDGSPLEAAAGS